MESLLNTDGYKRTRDNPYTGQTQRKWIEYADGVFEPVRRDGDLSRKYHGNKRTLDWWTVDKPLDWDPLKEGRDVSLNHHYGREDKPGRKLDRSIVPARPRHDADGRRTMELRSEDIEKGKPESLLLRKDQKIEYQPFVAVDEKKKPKEEDQSVPPQPEPPAQPEEGGEEKKEPPKTTLLRGAEAYHEFEAERKAQKAQKEAGAAFPQLTPGTTGKLAGADAMPPQQPGDNDGKTGSAAAGAGAAGGMVKPKGQHGKGKLISEDKIIKDLKERVDRESGDMKSEGKKELKRLQQQRSEATSPKEKNRIKKQMENLKAYIKLFGRYSNKSPLLITPFTEEQLENVIKYGDTPDKI